MYETISVSEAGCPEGVRGSNVSELLFQKWHTFVR